MFDKRNNISLCTKIESTWAIAAIRELPITLQRSFKAFVIGQNKRYHYSSKTPSDNASIVEWYQHAVNSDRKQHIEVVFSHTMPEYENVKLVRQRSFFENRGRNLLPSFLRRKDSIENLHGGIMSLDDTLPELEKFWPQPQFHAKAMFAPDTISDTSTALKLHRTGSPFIAGASGTIEYLVLDLHRGVSDSRKLKESDFELYILLNSIGLVAAGHHSLAETILAAKGYGFFKDVIDPRESYVGFLCGVSQHCKKYGIANHELDAIVSADNVRSLLDTVLKYAADKISENTQIKELMTQLASSENSELHTILEATQKTLSQADFSNIFNDVEPYLIVARDIVKASSLSPSQSATIAHTEIEPRKLLKELLTDPEKRTADPVKIGACKLLLAKLNNCKDSDLKLILYNTERVFSHTRNIFRSRATARKNLPNIFLQASDNFELIRKSLASSEKLIDQQIIIRNKPYAAQPYYTHKFFKNYLAKPSKELTLAENFNLNTSTLTGKG